MTMKKRDPYLHSIYEKPWRTLTFGEKLDRLLRTHGLLHYAAPRLSRKYQKMLVKEYTS